MSGLHGRGEYKRRALSKVYRETKLDSRHIRTPPLLKTLSECPDFLCQNNNPDLKAQGPRVCDRAAFIDEPVVCVREPWAFGHTDLL